MGDKIQNISSSRSPNTCDQDDDSKCSGSRHITNDSQLTNENVYKLETSYEEKCVPSLRKRVLESGKSLKDKDPCSGESNSNSRKKRKFERDMEQKKQRQFLRSNKSSIVDTRNELLGFSSRRKRSTKERIEKKYVKATMLSWLIDGKTIEENEEVFSVYGLSKQEKYRGKIQRVGILCACCNKTLSIEEFHVHGGKNCGKPYENVIVVRTRASLLFHMIETWNKPEEVDCCKNNIIDMISEVGDFYDDACMICADGGNLMCCEGCNSTYHQACVGLENVPEGSWFCPYCVCKFCADPKRGNDYLDTCPQCEKRYHWECHQMKDEIIMDLNNIPLTPFCEQSCKEVHRKLAEDLVGKTKELDEGYSWTLLRRMDDESGIFLEDKYLRTVCHCKLAISRMLMEECFEPIQDRYTRINVIPSVVYNCRANFNRINFKGFYTAILEKDEEIISVASLRIPGTKLAEMPFIVTSEEYRCRGMCKKLMVAIESALCHLNVESLIIPFVPEKIRTWVDRYGFEPLNAPMKKEIMEHNTLMFHDSVRLQKTLISSSHLARL